MTQKEINVRMHMQDLLIDFIQKWVRYDQLQRQEDADEYYEKRKRIEEFFNKIPVENMDAVIKIMGEVFDELDEDNPDHLKITASLINAIEIACVQRLICTNCWTAALEAQEQHPDGSRVWHCTNCGKIHKRVNMFGRPA